MTNNSVLLKSAEKIVIVADLKVKVKREVYCCYLIFHIKNNGRSRTY